MEEDLEVVPFLNGPAAGQEGEVPVSCGEVWRHVDEIGYCLYRRDAERSLVFTGIRLSREELTDWFQERGLRPWLHQDEDTPRARRVRVERLDP